MTDSSTDPYAVLGIAPDIGDAELRSAYRRLVQRHHPDHNNGSEESTRRFGAIQEAYARIVAARRAAEPGTSRASESGVPRASSPPAPGSTAPRSTAPGPTAAGGTTPGFTAPGSAAAPPTTAPAPRAAGRLRDTPYGDNGISAKVAAMERELYEARAAEERARQAAREAVSPPRRATPEELGYVTTDDSVGAILEDAREGLSKRWARTRASFAASLADLFSEAD
jgi:hypothetical protein